MRRQTMQQTVKRLAVAAALAAVPLILAGGAPASHNADKHSDNMSLIGTFNDGGTYREGSDLAFQGDRAVLGNYDNPGGFRLMDISNPSAPAEIAQFICPGPQNDVSIWGDLVFLSVDSPRGPGPDANAVERKADECGATAASQSELQSGAYWEGIRVVSIADPANPVQIAAVKTDCGSHTHTIVPDEANNRLLIYVLSYPLGGQNPDCNAASHRKISVVEVPLANPAAAKVVSTPSVGPSTIGCHDVTVLMPRKIAGAACISESQLWDISDPVNPKVISRIRNPAINISHSTTFTWDGKILVIGDELGGAALAPGCGPGGDHVPIGALWFYDVSDPANPQPRATYRVPQVEPSILCTAHNFNMLPLLSGRDVLTSAWYDGGTTVVDFTDPTDPNQLGFYIPKEGGKGTSWSSYWYNDRIYANNFESGAQSRGFDVMAINDSSLTAAIELPRLNPQTQEALPAQAGVTGGLITTQPPAPPPARGAPGGRRCRDRSAPFSRFNPRKVKASREKGFFVRGISDDRGCRVNGRGHVEFVQIAIALRVRKGSGMCRPVTNEGNLGRVTRCSKRNWLTVTGTTDWKARLKRRYPAGVYTIATRSIDSSVNFERRWVRRGKMRNFATIRVKK